MGNIYLYMRKNTTKKMKLKKIQLNKTKNNRQKKKGSVVRRMTIKKRGGGTQLLAEGVVVNPSDSGSVDRVSGGMAYAQMGLEKGMTIQSFLQEDLERKAAFVLREALHLTRQSLILQHNTPLVEQLKYAISSMGTGVETALTERLEANTKTASYLQQDYIMLQKMLQYK